MERGIHRRLGPQAFALCAALLAASVEAAPRDAIAPGAVTSMAPLPRLAALPVTPAALDARSSKSPATGDAACTRDGTLCIRSTHHIGDVCRALETEAAASGLDPHFFARLIWQESRFRPDAVSPAGALGIAQFMPGTAALRDLSDPLNPAAALRASARYLAEMHDRFGNLGLAAIGYNGGEARAERFIARGTRLPSETRAYVRIITGHGAEDWRHDQAPDPDLSLGPDAGFQAACVAMAERGARGAVAAAPMLRPWGVILASNRGRGGLDRAVARLQNRDGALLSSERVDVADRRLPGLPRRMHLAQVGRDSRVEADALCARLRAAGGDCMVLRN